MIYSVRIELKIVYRVKQSEHYNMTNKSVRGGILNYISAHNFALWISIDIACNELSFTNVGLKPRQILGTGDT